MLYFSYLNEVLEKLHERYNENYAEKGESWRKMSSLELKELFYKKYDKFIVAPDNNDRKLIFDMTNLLLMIGQRQIEESKN